MYTKLCLHLGLGKDELRIKWDRMEEYEKWVLVEEFVSNWSSNFHSLFASFVKHFVDQQLVITMIIIHLRILLLRYCLFSGLKKLMGFTDDK